MIKHFNITVSGRVQGVYYRASTKDKADELGIKGFVRNEPNGNVYVEAEGTQDQLDRLITWCKQGPPHAVVSSVDVKEGGVVSFEKFEIRR